MPWDDRPLSEKQHEAAEGRFAGGQWEPKFEDFAVGSDAPLATKFADSDPSEETTPWMDTPSTSHVMGFRLFDMRTNKFVKRWFGQSLLEVRFKSQNGRPASSYTYYFSDPQLAENIFQEMVGHPHPGEVVHARLILGRIPYQKRASVMGM